MKSASAVSRYVSPDAISSAIRCSVGVSAGWRGCAAADSRQLRVRLRLPQDRAEPGEDLECALERFAGGALLPIAPEDVAEDEERAGALERLLEPLVELERALELLASAARRSPRAAAQKRSAAAGHDEHPGRSTSSEPVELGRAALRRRPARRERSSPRSHRRESGTAPARGGQSPRPPAARRLSARSASRRVSERELEEAESREQLEAGRPAAHLVRQPRAPPRSSPAPPPRLPRWASTSASTTSE